MKVEDLQLGAVIEPVKSRTDRRWKIIEVRERTLPSPDPVNAHRMNWKPGDRRREFRLYPEGMDVRPAQIGGRFNGGVRQIIRTEEELLDGWRLLIPGPEASPIR